jgi:hypothetical protein
LQRTHPITTPSLLPGIIIIIIFIFFEIRAIYHVDVERKEKKRNDFFFLIF